MRALLADLALEAEASLRMTARVARAFDRSAHDPNEAALARLGVTLAKYWICKRAPAHTFEAMECLGGNGYIEDFGMARRYREAPVNSIWEGSGNVIALDVVRALEREPECFEALFEELARARGAWPALDALVDEAEALAARGPARLVSSARRLTELLALALQASAMREGAPEAVGDAFVASRLGPDRGARLRRAPGAARQRRDHPRARAPRRPGARRAPA